MFDEKFEEFDATFEKIGDVFELFDREFEKTDEAFEMFDGEFEEFDATFEKIGDVFELFDEAFETFDEAFETFDEAFEKGDEAFELFVGYGKMEICRTLMETNEVLLNKLIYIFVPKLSDHEPYWRKNKKEKGITKHASERTCRESWDQFERPFPN